MRKLVIILIALAFVVVVDVQVKPSGRREPAWSIATEKAKAYERPQPAMGTEVTKQVEHELAVIYYNAGKKP